MLHYVYALIDPRTDQPFYVGKGKGQRANQHLYPGVANSSGNSFRRNLIRKIRAEGMEPILVFLHENLSEQQACELEITEIAKYGRRRFDPEGILVNLTTGGEGTSGFAHYAETKRKIGSRVKAAWLKRKSSPAYADRPGRVMTEAQMIVVKKAGAASAAKSRGKPRSDEVRRKIRETKAANPRSAGRGVACSAEARKRMSEGQRKRWERYHSSENLRTM